MPTYLKNKKMFLSSYGALMELMRRIDISSEGYLPNLHQKILYGVLLILDAIYSEVIARCSEEED